MLNDTTQTGAPQAPEEAAGMAEVLAALAEEVQSLAERVAVLEGEEMETETES